MQKPVSLFTLAALAIVACWWWLGTPVAVPPSPLQAGEKLYCVSYAPFRGTQTPLDLSTRIEAAQIEQDLAQLAKLTDCVRIYSVDAGLDQIPHFGDLFSHNDNTTGRTELIIFIRPQIIRDGTDAHYVAEELRSKLRGTVKPVSETALVSRVQ